MFTPPSTTSILSVRVNPEERALLEMAAQQARTNLSDFIRRKALEAAEIDILNRTTVTIPAEDWDMFESWVNKPADAIPALAALSELKPSWER